ncbi:MAG: 5-formyltetrahydrofolate cyclo-ligase [Gammaproteobacteria bacterium]|nr:5-formyltetrahydrofolate cyclo-ligase [Gammaproteobacteria bacterium]
MYIDKPELREILHEKRRKLSPLAKIRKSKRITNNIQKNTDFLEGKSIGLYCSTIDEVDTSFLLNTCLDRNKSVFLPVIQGKTIVFGKYDPRKSSMIKNRYNIPEPSLNETEIFPIDQLDLVFVPMLGFNSSCDRIGMGGGFYDRTFEGIESLPLRLVGLAFACQEASFFSSTNDIPMSAVCTEDRIIYKNKSLFI